MDMLEQQSKQLDDEASHAYAEHRPEHTPQHSPEDSPASDGRFTLLKKIAVPIAIILGAVGVVGAFTMLDEAPEKKAPAFTALAVETMTVQSEDMAFSIASQGSVAPRTETALVSEVSGVVLEVSPKLQTGGFFREDEVLLTVDPNDYEAAVKQAQASLLGKRAQLTQEIAQADQAEKEWALSGRPRSEAPVLALRQPFLDKAKAEVLFAEAELQQARRKMERTRIRAPYDGLIKSKSVGKGQYVTVGTPLAEIFAVDYAEVRLPVSNDDIAFIDFPRTHGDVGGKGSVDAAQARLGELGESDGADRINGPKVILTTVIGGKAQRWSATIVRSEGIVDSRSRVHYLVAQINDPYGFSRDSSSSSENAPRKPSLSIGSFVKAEIQGISLAGVVAIPRKAMRDATTVMVRDREGRLRMRQATVVRSDNEHVYITGGVQSGEEVITTAIISPVEGMELRKIESRLASRS